MKDKPKLFTFRRGLAAVMCASMLTSIVNIMTIGLAYTQLPEDVDIAIYQQVGATSTISSDNRDVKPGDPVTYHVEAKIKVPEEVDSGDSSDESEDVSNVNTITEESLKNEEGSLFGTEAVDNSDTGQDSADNSSDDTPDNPSSKEDDVIPTVNSTKYNAYIKLYTDTQFEMVDSSKFNFSAVRLSDISDTAVSWECVEDNDPRCITIKCKEVSENCQVSIAVPGTVSASMQDGDSLQAYATLQLVPLKDIDGEYVEQSPEELKTSNTVYMYTALSYNIKGHLSCNNLTLSVAGQEFKFIVTKSKDGTILSKETKLCKPDNSFNIVDETYDEPGKYTYVVKQEKLVTTADYNIVQDFTEYVIVKNITRDISTGALNEVECTITKDGEPYNSKELVFTNSVEEVKDPTSNDTKSVNLTGKVVAGKVQLKGGEFTFTLTPGIAKYKDTDDDDEETESVPEEEKQTTYDTYILARSQYDSNEDIDEDFHREDLPPIHSGLESIEDDHTESTENNIVDSGNTNSTANNSEGDEHSDSLDTIEDSSDSTDKEGTENSDSSDTDSNNNDANSSDERDSTDTSEQEQSDESNSENADPDVSDSSEFDFVDDSDVQDETTENQNDTETEAEAEAPSLELPSDEFETTLEDDAPLASVSGVSPSPKDGVLQVTNTASGDFTFGEIEFDRPGVYQYEISQNPTSSGYKNDQRYTATVTVDTTNDNLTEPKVSLKDAQGLVATSLIFENDEDALTPSDPTTSVPNVSIEATQSTSESGTYSKDPVKVRDGASVYYRVTIKNNGTAGADDTTINVPIPEGMTYVQGSGGNGVNVHSSSLSWTVRGSFASGKDISCSFQLKIPSTTSATSWTVSPYVTYSNNPNNLTNDLERVLSNELVAQRDSSDNNSGTVSSTGLEVNVMQARNNESASTSDITVYSGDKIKYTVTVTNRGDSAVENISVTAEFPSGLRVQSSDVSSNGVISTNNILWNLTKLDAGKSVSYTFTGTVDAVTSSKDLVVRATAYPSNNTSQISTSNIVTAQAFAASSYKEMQITIKQSLDSLRNATDKDLQVKAGDEVTYYITVENTSNNASQKVTITDNVPSGMEVVANSISDSGKAENGKVTWELDAIPAKNSKTVSFTVKIPETGTSWDNAATLNIVGDTGNGTKSNTVKATVNSTGLSIALTQALNSGSSTTEDITVLQNDTITYTFTVTNATSSEATDVIVTDTIPSLFTIEQDSITTGGSANGNTITWNIGNIPANSRYTVGVRVTSGTTGNGSKHINKGTVKYRTGSTDNSIDSNKVTAVFQVSGIPYQPQEQTPTIDEPTTPTIQENTSNYTPEVDASIFQVGGKIPQTGGFTELHMWIFLFIVSGGGLILMSFTGKKRKHAW